MYRSHRILLYIIFVLFFALSLFVKINYSGLLLACITISFTITFGVAAISISTMYGKQFLRNLYLTRDLRNPDQPQLYTLRDYFQSAIALPIFSIGLLIFVTIISHSEELLKIWGLSVYSVVCLIGQAMILPLLLVNMCMLYWLMDIMLKGLVDEAKKKNQ